jgi:hypothetical protein
MEKREKRSLLPDVQIHAYEHDDCIREGQFHSSAKVHWLDNSESKNMHFYSDSERDIAVYGVTGIEPGRTRRIEGIHTNYD